MYGRIVEKEEVSLRLVKAEDERLLVRWEEAEAEWLLVPSEAVV